MRGVDPDNLIGEYADYLDSLDPMNDAERDEMAAAYAAAQTPIYPEEVET